MSITNLQVTGKAPIRVKDAAIEACCSDSHIYRGANEGWYKSWRVIRPGFNRGILYIDGPSFRKWLMTQRQGEEISVAKGSDSDS